MITLKESILSSTGTGKISTEIKDMLKAFPTVYNFCQEVSYKEKSGYRISDILFMGAHVAYTLYDVKKEIMGDNYYHPENFDISDLKKIEKELKVVFDFCKKYLVYSGSKSWDGGYSNESYFEFKDLEEDVCLTLIKKLHDIDRRFEQNKTNKKAFSYYE